MTKDGRKDNRDENEGHIEPVKINCYSKSCWYNYEWKSRLVAFTVYSIQVNPISSQSTLTCQNEQQN